MKDGVVWLLGLVQPGHKEQIFGYLYQIQNGNMHETCFVDCV
jgi:hypothetical protein